MGTIYFLVISVRFLLDILILVLAQKYRELVIERENIGYSYSYSYGI